MLCRRFITRPLTLHTFTQRDAAAAAGMPPFVCVPTSITKCVGIFGRAKNCIIKAHGIIKSDHIEPVNKWTWDPFCKQFADLVYDPTLSLPNTGTTMLPAMQVFGKLEINEKQLINPPKGRYCYEHCNIEGVMKGMGYESHPTWQTPGYDKFLESNQRMITQLAFAREDELNKVKRSEEKIDVGAERFLQLCGFDDGGFSITALGDNFDIFGSTCYSQGDWYVVQSMSKDLVLVFEDKSAHESRKTLDKQGHLGQIVGEMLQMLSMNRRKRVFRNVFGVRYVNSHVCGFRLDPSKQQLKTLVKTRNVPSEKLKLLCTENDPVKSRGWWLIDKQQRMKALQLMADIRAFILSSK